jgi:phospholipid:diacylglycerol acyltransferase
VRSITFHVPAQPILIERKSHTLHPTVGLVFGLTLIPPHHLPDLPNHLSVLMQDMPGLSMPELDFARVEAEWSRLRSSIQIPEVWKLNTDGREFQVGEEAKQRGLSAKYPVVLIPGIISTVKSDG